MQQHNIFKNQDEFPDTNYFSYNGRNYPFKSDFFKISSKYFARNLKLLEKNQTIPLLEHLEAEGLDISDESINTFIGYVQHKEIQITNENVFPLNYLANKYEVTSLQCITDNYISENHQELILQILTIHQNDKKFDTSSYEKVLSEKLSYYYKDKRLLFLKVPVLYRVFELNQKESNSKNDSIEKIDFLFECLEKYKKEASSLFTFVDFGNLNGDYLNRLLKDYSDVFDFHFINKEMVKNFYEQQSEVIKLKEENLMLQEKSRQILCELEGIKSEQANVLSEINRKNEGEINSLKNEVEKMIGEVKKSVGLKDDKIKEQEQLIQKMVNENDEIKKRLLDVEKILKKQEEEELRRKQEEEELRRKQEEEELRRKQEEELRKKQEEELRKKQEEELRKKQEEQNTKTLIYASGREFDGIFDYLSKENNGNPHLKSIINITSNGDSYNHCYDLIDKQFQDYFYPNCSSNSFVQFDFKQYKVSISNYSLKSNGNSLNKLINWEIVGSNNANNWDQIDERHISEWNGAYNVSTYSTHNLNFYRYVQIRLKGQSSSNDNYLVLSSIELFGKLKK